VVGGDVIAATENDTIYAIARATGKTVWRTHVGTPVPQSALHGCGDIFPLGITGTPVYDTSTGLIYAVAETTGYHHVLIGLNVQTGTVKIRRDIDVSSAGNQPAWNQQRPALAIDGGRVYAAFGGLAGDCGAYIGGVVGVALNGKGSLVSWHTPTSREGAVWGTAGPVAAPHGALWISNGNGAAGTGDPYDGSDSVTSLSPALHRKQYFAPASWAADNTSDLDLGSTQPVRAAGSSTFIMGKRGVGYLLSSTKLGGIGGQLASAVICPAYGAAADDGSTVYEPCQSGGMAAISVSAAKKTIKVLWRGPADGNGSPVIGGGAVWVTAYDRSGGRSGTLYELSPSTGAVRQQITIGVGLPHFSSLSLGGSTAYLDTLDGVTAINGA
jgi:outer membrane protein assembly factor BamB